jgi:hypothetical protein
LLIFSFPYNVFFKSRCLLPTWSNVLCGLEAPVGNLNGQQGHISAWDHRPLIWKALAAQAFIKEKKHSVTNKKKSAKFGGYPLPLVEQYKKIPP